MALLVRPSSVCRHSVCFNVSKRYVASRAARSGPGRVWTSSNEVARPDHTWSASWRARKAACRAPRTTTASRPARHPRCPAVRRVARWPAGRAAAGRRRAAAVQRPAGRSGRAWASRPMVPPERRSGRRRIGLTPWRPRGPAQPRAISPWARSVLPWARSVAPAAQVLRRTHAPPSGGLVLVETEAAH